MYSVNHPKGQGGLVPGIISVAFVKTFDEAKANQLVEAAGYQLSSFDKQCHIARVVCPVGKEAQAIMALNHPGITVAERMMKHVLMS